MLQVKKDNEKQTSAATEKYVSIKQQRFQPKHHKRIEEKWFLADVSTWLFVKAKSAY